MRRTRSVGVSTLIVLSIALLLGAGALDEIRGLAGGMTDRSPIADDAAVLDEMLELVAKLDAGELASAAKDHARVRAGELGSATGQGGGPLSVYRDLMRYPQANRGAAVVAVGRVTRIEEPTEELRGQILWIVPRGEPGGEAAVLLPADVDPPEVGNTIETTGIFAKRIVVAKEGEKELVAPLLVTADWRTRGVGQANGNASWAVVEDRTLGVRAEESQLYYEVLGQAASVDPAIIREQAREFEARRRQANPQWVRDGEYWMFADLIEKPAECRGQPVTLVGYAREVRSYPAGENAAGIETLYEIWMFTDTSQSNPAVVIASDVPQELPTGDDLQVPLRVTGYFLKLYGYHAASKTRIAPMLLAGPVKVLPEPELEGFPWWMIALVAGGSLLALVWILISFRGDRRRIKKSESEPPPDFSGVE